MNKFDKLQIASILQDWEAFNTGDRSKSIASTSAYAMAGAKKNGFDQGDLVKLTLDQSFDSDQQGGLMKIMNNIGIHFDDIKRELKERGDGQGLMALASTLTHNPNLPQLMTSLYGLLKKWTKHAEGGEIKDGSKSLYFGQLGGYVVMQWPR